MTRLSKLTASKQFRVLVTTGDLDGVGWEVTAKAFNSIKAIPGVQFLVFRSRSKAAPKPKISKFKTKALPDLKSALAEPFNNRLILEILSNDAPANWVETAAKACVNNQAHALVTAPLSKTSIVDAGFKDIGHTEILQRISGEPDLFMGFIGNKFNVLLGTGHKPLVDAIRSLNLNHLAKVFTAARLLVKALPKNRQNKPLALVGVNPHAGEGGLIGSEEGWMQGLLEDQRVRGLRISGPLVPDAAFLPKNWPLFSAYVCLYHDQGLIPFKMIHGHSSGVHITLGLPFIRTSVDHGTAKELFGRNKADPGSMRDAIETAVRLLKERE